MNTLLLRQLKKHFPKDLSGDERFHDFINAVNKSYGNYEDQLKVSQRAAKISSDELFEANSRLREDAENQKKMESDRDIIIAIDAGHGGEDPGSIGGKGNYEKRITLAISKKLEALINKQPGLTAVMTRTGDYYISVHGRTEKARNANDD